ncbi:MAG: hypothetical protein RL662_640 [Bacteroidota bacterium]
MQSDEDVLLLNLDELKKKVKVQIKDWIKYSTLASGELMMTAIINGLYVDVVDFNLDKLERDDLVSIFKILVNNGVEPISKMNEKDLSTVKTIISKCVEGNKDASKLMFITNFATQLKLDPKNIAEVETLTNRMIATNQDPSIPILGLLFEFKYGVGPTIREFDKTSLLTKAMLNNSMVEKGRNEFYKRSRDAGGLATISKDSKDGAFVGVFGLSGLVESGLNLVTQFVGGFYMEMIPNKAGTQMEFILYNDMNLKSLVAHYFGLNDLGTVKPFPEKYPRIKDKVTPLGETRQIFRWTEVIDYNKLKE